MDAFPPATPNLVPYAELRHSDRVQIPRTVCGQVVGWSHHLTVDHVQWINDHALLLHLADPAPVSGDQVLLIVGDHITSGVHRVGRTIPAHQLQPGDTAQLGARPETVERVERVPGEKFELHVYASGNEWPLMLHPEQPVPLVNRPGA